MELNQETIAGIAVGGIAAIVIAKPMLHGLGKVAEPYEFGWIEYRTNPQGRSYWQIVRENRKQLKNLDKSEYLDGLVKRLAEGLNQQPERSNK